MTAFTAFAVVNNAWMTTSTTGSGTITLGSAATIGGQGYQTFANAGVTNGQTVHYKIACAGPYQKTVI